MQEKVEAPPAFPPQSVLKSGDYAGFLAENEAVLKTCQDPEKCAVALFNLSFLYIYSPSPYYDPSRGLKHLEDLVKSAPENPLSSQAQVWIDLLKKIVKKEVKKRRTREDPKPKDTAPEEPVKQEESIQENNAEADRRRLETDRQRLETDRSRLADEVKARDDMIKELKGQIERSRKIDLEIEKKERGLLY
ncbi:MAG: hypothetical protein AB9866_10770 [Syntrophobacteraceae bacterium]